MIRVKAILLLVVFIVPCFILITSSVSAKSAEVHGEEGSSFYPDRFDGRGIIDRMDERGIVINDMFYLFSPVAKFVTPQNEYASQRYFESGKSVGYLLTKSGQIEILYLASPVEEDAR